MKTTWDLTELYQSIDDPKIKTDQKAAGELIKKLEGYRGKIAGLTSTELLKLIQTKDELDQLLYKMDLFASLLDSTQKGVDKVTRFTKQIETFITNEAKKIVFIDVEISHLDNAAWQKHIDAPELKPYQHLIKTWQRDAKYVLSEAEEKILADKSQTSWQSLIHLYDITTDTLMIPWEGKDVSLSEVITKLHDESPEVRKQAALAVHKTLKTNDKTTPAIYNSLVQDKQISDDLRGYTYSEEARFNHDDVDKPTVDALVQAVNSQSSMVADYYELKKKLLDAPKLYWWDRYAPLPRPQQTFSIEQAQTMVLDSFGEFSDNFKTIVQTMFDKQHIDWLPSATKRGGAFCAFSGKEIYPYVLMNFTGATNDVLTLAHELGHAIHDVLAGAAQPFCLAHPSLAQAEIASTFAEELLFEKLMASDITKEDKIALLMERIEGNFATVHRQIAMFQFEQAIHTKRKEEGELSHEEINNLWHETIKKPFGDSLEWTDEHKNYWMYVSHVIHSPFYVYSYAFAQLCTLALVQSYKEAADKQTFAQTYTDLLATGGSLSPKDNLAKAGLDISQPEFWSKGLDLIAEDIKSLKNLI